MLQLWQAKYYLMKINYQKYLGIKLEFLSYQIMMVTKKKFKKIIKNNYDLEFDIERDMLLTETLPKLQQYFLTQGVYVNLIDCNLNWNFDLTQSPYHILHYIKELEHAYRTSTGLFLLVRLLFFFKMKEGIYT